MKSDDFVPESTESLVQFSLTFLSGSFFFYHSLTQAIVGAAVCESAAFGGQWSGKRPL